MSAADLRKGWCPGALRPMAARDGLLVRVKITGGIVPASTVCAIADMAEGHGNGLLDLSARANLQLRGVSEATLSGLLDGLAGLGLLDDDPGGEAVRNVLCSPLAGLVPGRPDIRPMASALEAALVGDPTLRALPPKFGFLIDDGSAPSLAGVAADVRFDWNGAKRAFSVGLGGAQATALPLGMVVADRCVAAAIAIARRSIAVPGPPRRARTLLRDCGRETIAAAFADCLDVDDLHPAATPSTDRRGAEPADVVGHRTFGSVPTLGLAAPYGRLDAAMLRAVAGATSDELRLTPWRTMLVPQPIPAIDLRVLAGIGFITDPSDPRLRVAACTGLRGCERGTTDTHADASALAPFVAALPGEIALHVSGCAKGCARPSRTALTLVGRDGRYDLLRDGRPGDMPVAEGLDLAEFRKILAAA